MAKRISRPSRQPPLDVRPDTGPRPSAAAAPASTPLGALTASAWRALLAIAHSPQPHRDPTVTDLLQPDPTVGWRSADRLPPPLRDFLDLYLPFCRLAAHAPLLVGHLGQSLDGCIATRAGESCFVTGPANITHLHRMRALADAVLVGAGTVAHDDPRLTTRLVPGPCPVRVVLDPRGRLGRHHRLFTDGAAPTLLVRASTDADGHAAGPGPAGVNGPTDQVEILPAALTADGAIDLPWLLACLQRRGLRRLFIEGGGVTVSAFLAQGLLTRLQIAVAPLIIGQGRPGVSLPPPPDLARALRPACRVYRMGDDMLYDLELTAGAAHGGTDPGLLPVRIR
ncbi:MAG: RibD family protein [Chromatiaceae bacterium]|nr:MAG: RibD family protein [Chromatiaceae bacterium]